MFHVENEIILIFAKLGIEYRSDLSIKLQDVKQSVPFPSLAYPARRHYSLQWHNVSYAKLAKVDNERCE